jgi:hypothetical protein
VATGTPGDPDASATTSRVGGWVAGWAGGWAGRSPSDTGHRTPGGTRAGRSCCGGTRQPTETPAIVKAAIARATSRRPITRGITKQGAPSNTLHSDGTIAVSVIACPSASRLSCGSSSGHVTYTAGRTRPRHVGVRAHACLQRWFLSGNGECWSPNLRTLPALWASHNDRGAEDPVGARPPFRSG